MVSLLRQVQIESKMHENETEQINQSIFQVTYMDNLFYLHKQFWQVIFGATWFGATHGSLTLFSSPNF